MGILVEPTIGFGELDAGGMSPIEGAGCWIGASLRSRLSAAPPHKGAVRPSISYKAAAEVHWAAAMHSRKRTTLFLIIAT